MMRILVIALRYFEFGGAENVMRSLTSEISKFDDVELAMLTNKYKRGGGNFEKVYTSHFYDIPFINNIEPMFIWRRALKKAINEVKPDLIHMHGCIVPIPKSIPSLMTVHGTYKNELQFLLKHPISPFYKTFYSSLVYSQYLYEKHTYKFANFYHAVSVQTKKELVEIGIAPDKIFVIPNGVYINKFYPKDTKERLLDKLDLKGNAKIALYVGGIVPRKGIHVLIKAIPHVLKEHNAHFIFVGETPRLAKSYTKYLYDLTNSLNVKDFVHFLGRVSDEELISYYNACDLFVSPSYSEGCSLNILEAAACGKKVVATDVGGARDILGEYGYYVKPDDFIGLAKEIVRAMDEKSNGEKIRIRIERNFSWENIGRRVVDLYEKCIENGGEGCQYQ